MNTTKVAFLGLGAMGQRMAARLSAAGHSVTVWSRSGAAAHPGFSAVASSPREAAAGADVVIAMVTDDDASRDVWSDPERGALAGLRPGALALECSTLTPPRVLELAGEVRAKGGRFLEAPVVGSRPQAESGALISLVGGDAADVEAARPILEATSAAIHHVGPTPAGAIVKLLVNALFGVQVAALAELLGVARRSEIDPARFVDVLATLPVLSPAARGAAASMIAERFDPMFPVALVEKDFAYFTAEAAARGARVPVIERAGEVFSVARWEGLAAQNLTAIARLYR